MDSSLTRKIEKARNYAQQPDRIQFINLMAKFRGDNGDHTITFEAGDWFCSCNYFSTRAICSHTMAMQITLEGMTPARPVAPPPHIPVETTVKAPVLAP